jgi:hypothetical protein
LDVGGGVEFISFVLALMELLFIGIPNKLGVDEVNDAVDRFGVVFAVDGVAALLRPRRLERGEGVTAGG